MSFALVLRPFFAGLSVAALSALLALPAAAQTGSGATLRVPQDFDTIQQAVDAAQSGDTILIAKGEYPEEVLVSGKTDLIIRGKGKPVILGPGVITTDGGDGFEAGGLSISSCTGVELKGVVVRASVKYPGIGVNSSTDVSLIGCAVDTVIDADAIGVSSSTHVIIDRCKLSDGENDAIAISSSTNVQVLRTKADNFGDIGVRISSSDSVRVERCKFTNFDNTGIQVSNNGPPVKVLIEKVRISDVADEGIAISGQYSNVTILRTRIDRPGNHAVRAAGGELLIEKLVVRDAGGSGVEADPISGASPGDAPPAPGGIEEIEHPVRLTKLKLRNCNYFGVKVRADGAVLDGLVIKDTGDEGLLVSDSEGVDVRNVRIVGGQSGGVEFVRVDTSSVEKVRVAKSEYGLEVDALSSGNTFSDIRIVAPEDTGVEAEGSGCSYTNVVVRKAGDYGFLVSGTGNTFTDNAASKSGAVDLSDTSGVGANTYVDNAFGTEQFETD